MRSFLADLILILHGCIVLFIAGGLVAVPLGAAAQWKAVRHRGFRLAHLIAMAFVATETLLAIACPLTVWEEALRGMRTKQGFVERLLHWLIFYDLPTWVFAVAYVLGVLLAVVLWRWVPPLARRTNE